MSDPLIAAIVLAAGSSTRFGTENKLLASIDGRSVIESVFFNVTNCGFDYLLAVVAPDQSEIETLARSARVTTVINRRTASGVGGSIACGVKQILQQSAGSFSGVAIYLGDMPAIGRDTSLRLLEEFKRHDCDQIVRPAYAASHKSVPGHPVFFPADFFPMLERLTGDKGAKCLIEAHRHRLAEVRIVDSGVIRDIDHPWEL